MAHPEPTSDERVSTTSQSGIEPRGSHPPSFGSRLVQFLFCVSLLGFVVYFTPNLVSLLVSDFREAWHSRSWPTVTGTVLCSEVKTTGMGNRTKSKALVTYHYEVNGTVYTGHRICVDGFAKKVSERAQAVSARYVVGDEIQVHYDPHNPANALLVPGPTGGMWMVVIFPIFLCCVVWCWALLKAFERC